jgi:N-alpha-acetyl-L-2,4-diaminobutyrate deacetylase
VASEARVQSRIASDIDFDRDGRQATYLRAPLSRNTAGWGTVEIPIVTVKNGSGPTILLTGGIHGDVATSSIVINSIPRVMSAVPGLHTMRDLPLPSFFPGR